MTRFNSQPGDFCDTAYIAAVEKCEPITVLRRARAGRIPSPVFQGSNVTLWDRRLIEAWVRAGRPQDVAAWLASRAEAKR